jgi:hypothetical protein
MCTVLYRRAELEAQIQERAKQKAAEKSQRAAEEARKEAEMAAYCPWGRAGAGAPLRDATGQVRVSTHECNKLFQLSRGSQGGNVLYIAEIGV